MTIQDKIAALPEWPEPIKNFDISLRDWGRWQHEGRLAALARLALAREWIEDAHGVGCATHRSVFDPDVTCDCGRDALVKALEQP